MKFRGADDWLISYPDWYSLVQSTPRTSVPEGGPLKNRPSQRGHIIGIFLGSPGLFGYKISSFRHLRSSGGSQEGMFGGNITSGRNFLYLT